MDIVARFFTRRCPVFLVLLQKIHMFEVAEAYEEMMGRFSRSWRRCLSSSRVGLGDVVVDVGCGIGTLASTLASMTRAAKLVGIDSSAPFVAARTQITDPHVTIELGDAQNLPYADASGMPSAQSIRQ